jgi:hypothetical protein
MQNEAKVPDHRYDNGRFKAGATKSFWNLNQHGAAHHIVTVFRVFLTPPDPVPFCRAAGSVPAVVGRDS